MVNMEENKQPEQQELSLFGGFLICRVCSPCESKDCNCSEHAGVDHLLNSNCTHQVVEHNGHYDFVMNGNLHHLHNNHFDNHGIYDPAKCKPVNLYMHSIRKLVTDTLGSDTFGIISHDYPEPGNEKRQYNLTSEEKKQFVEQKEAKIRGMKKDQCRLLAMMSLTGFFMVVEFVVGIIAGALALQADAMHMASDLIALIVGYCAISLSQRPENESDTYGWSRFEVVGAMVNSVFLLSVCLNIVIEAVTRMFDISEVEETMEKSSTMYLVVAVLGLVINVLGLFFLSCGDGDGHAHHHHGHSHGHDHEGEHDDDEEEEHDHDHDQDHEHEHEKDHDHDHEKDHDHDHDHDHEASAVVVDVEQGQEKPKEEKKKKHSANLQAVILHVAGDAMGSIAAIISACIVKYVPRDQGWRFYADPVCSLLIVILILSSCIPLFKSVLNILLQSAPKSLNMGKLRESILRVDGVLYIHGLHVWQLNEDVTVGSVHVICKHDCNHQLLMDRVKKVFHSANIHSSCVQVEVVRDQGVLDVCNDIVCSNKNCIARHCCASQRIGREVSGQTSENTLIKASSI